MTQAIGLATALVLLAFLLVLYTLLVVTVKRFLEGDSQGARGPLFILGALVLISTVSVFSWARGAIENAVASVGWALGTTGGLVTDNPLSLVCLGPLILVILFTLATPGARHWLGNNYLPLSVLVLAAAFLGSIIYLVVQASGGWGVLGLLVLLGLVIGLGSRGLVFVPELGDGPRLGEGAASSAVRIARLKARRGAYVTSRSIISLPSRVLTRQGAPVLGLVVVFALGGWWYSGRSEARPEAPVAVIVVSTPTATVPDVVRLETPSPTAAATTLRVVNTGGVGVLMRDQPSRSGEQVASLPEGTSLDIAGPEQDADGITWRQVKEKGGKVGWVSSQYLAVERVYGVVRIANSGGEGVNLRDKPSKIGKVLVLLKEGTVLKVVGEDTKADGLTWRNVKDDKDNVGWVSSQYLSP